MTATQRTCVPFGSLDRRTILGASEVACVLGMSRYYTPLAIYLAKHRTDAQLIDKRSGSSGPALWGNRLERAILDGYDADVLAQLESGALMLLHGGDEVGTVLHPEYAWQAASPDGIVTDADGTWLWGVEVKNVDRGQAHRWGDTGTDAVPDEYALQCHWAMHVTGLDRWDVVALIGGNDCRTYTLRRDDELLASVVAAMEAFWRDHVLAHSPPEATAPDNELLSRLMRQGADSMIAGDREIDTLVAALAPARTARASADDAVDLIEAKIKLRIGDRAGAEGPWGKIVWRQSKPRRIVGWEALAQALGVTEAMIAAHTTDGAAARPFRVTLAEG